MARVIRCHDCDLLHEVQVVPRDARALCARCGALLFAEKRDTVERTLALELGALILWAVANAFPFMTLELGGRRQPSHLVSGVFGLYDDGLWQLALLVLLFVIVFPLLKILSHLFVLVPLHLGWRPRYLAPLFRLVDALHPWSMTEVFLLGVLVAYTKLVDLATILAGPSLVAFVGLILVLIWGDIALEPAEVWDRIRRAPDVNVPPPAERARLVGCHACQQVTALPAAAGSGPFACPRCGATLHRRKHDSLSRCWALVIAAAILYVPANLYPVMTLVSFGRSDSATILGGVQELLVGGMWPLALLVFFASITVPMLKLIGLVFLLVSTQRGSRWHPRERTVLYRIVEAVGRWSMLDIFVLAILAGLVRLGSIATIEPGLGALSFGAVVVLTMFAAMSFDPRLLWDAAGANRDG